MQKKLHAAGRTTGLPIGRRKTFQGQIERAAYARLILKQLWRARKSFTPTHIFLSCDALRGFARIDAGLACL